uniref:Thaumatin-like protein n=1 Tax=Aegilops tauschii subsp. strangulata TaxID=200361 RepID=A0A453DXQ4_AEGTS
EGSYYQATQLAVMGTSSLSLHHPPPLLLLLRLLLLLPFVTTQTILNITNRCPYTVWPAALPVGGGMRLDSGKTWTLQVPSDTRGGSVWARTGCSFDGKGSGSCQTGDCEGLLACKIDGQPPYTSAEFSLNQYNNNSFFGISLDQGFNVPMEFLPMPVKGQGGSGCRKGPHCGANITSQCPSELKAPGGCNSACTVFQEQNNGMYCCYESQCEPNKYSAFFVRMCPEAISYSSDASTDTSFSCPFDTDYQVIFCPPVNLTSSPPSPPNSADLRPLSSPPSPPNSADLSHIHLFHHTSKKNTTTP